MPRLRAAMRWASLSALSPGRATTTLIETLRIWARSAALVGRKLFSVATAPASKRGLSALAAKMKRTTWPENRATATRNDHWSVLAMPEAVSMPLTVEAVTELGSSPAIQPDLR